MIDFATKNDITALSRMWQGVFLEEKEVTDYFFEGIFENTVTPLIKIDGEIVSSLFLLDCKIGEHKGKCVYCAMTAYAHRGKGYMKKLLDFSYDYCKKNGFDFLTLVPAEKSLFEYYAKCGFSPFGVRKSYVLNGEIPENKQKLEYQNELVFEKEILKYWEASCEHYGGKVTDFGLAFDDDNVIIRNARGSFEEIPEEYRINGTKIQGDITFGDEEAPAMIKTENEYIKKSNCYIGITLE